MTEKNNKAVGKKDNRKQINKYYEISACALLFGIAMVIIGVFL